jgi:hypothetical protein
MGKMPRMCEVADEREACQRGTSIAYVTFRELLVTGDCEARSDSSERQ